MKGRNHITVLYENDLARKDAVAFCNELNRRFWRAGDLETLFCSFADLGNSIKGGEAAAAASKTSLLIFAATPAGKLPPDLESWVSLWKSERGGLEGALIDLHDFPESERATRLRMIAHQTGLNFLTGLPEHFPEKGPETVEAYAERAGQMTSVLDDILKRKPDPTLLSL